MTGRSIRKAGIYMLLMVIPLLSPALQAGEASILFKNTLSEEAHYFSSHKNEHAVAITISGLVTDQEGEPLIGVNIQVKDTNKGTSTDFDGRFTLEEVDENAVLVVSYIGYRTQEVSVAGKSNLVISMTSDSQLLDEVVVVGYGTREKGRLTGSVSSGTP